MRLDRCSLWLLTLGQLFALASPLRAQSVIPPAAKAEAQPEKPAGRTGQAVERVEPDIYYMKDKNGDLIPLLNHSLEEIKKLLELRDSGGAPPRPGFRLERLIVQGDVIGDCATLSIELSIVASDARWVRVPLRLGNLVLTELAKFADEGEHFVDFEPDSREYVAWFRGKADEPHRLTLRGLAPLEKDGAQTRLRLNAPRAVFSEIEFGVPSAHTEGQVISGGVLANTTPLAGRTQFRATGLANDFSLSWHSTEADRAAPPVVLSVDSQIVSQIDGRGVDTTATLKLSAFGREFSSFRVRLPRGATLLPMDQSDYSVVELAPPADAPEEQRERKVVEVWLKAKTSSSVSVKLVTKQGHDVTREGTFELGGFDVLGAVRQSGFLAVQARDDWQVAFLAPQGVLQTDELPTEMRGDNVVAGFIYFGQPYSLPARISPRQTRTSVEPTYLVEAGPRHLQLDATFRYHIAGAKVFSFSIELGDWQLDPAGLESQSLINAAAVVVGAGNSVLVPLKQATTGEVELKIRARKPIGPGAEAIEFGLPHPAADTVGSTELVVLPEDNVLLTPRADEMSGLSSAPPNPNVKLPAQRQSAWYYRSDVGDPRFAAGFRVAARRLTSRVETQIMLSKGAAKVRQKLASTVLHEAAESLLLVAPRALAQAGTIEVKWQGEPLPLSPETSDETGDEDLVGLRIHFPGPQLGDFELAVSYDWEDVALNDLPSRATVKAEIPLVMPGEGEITDNQVTLSAEPRLNIEPVDKGWTLAEIAPRERGRQQLVFSSSQPRTGLVLGISPTDDEANGSLVVDRIWVQTWLTDNQRVERAVFHFRSQDRRLRLKLPPGRSTETFRLDDKLDVTPLHGETLDERVFTLPETGLPDKSHVLEATYDLPHHAGGAGSTFELPELTGTGTAPHVYWQLVLPRNEYLVSGPARLANDFVWTWKGVGWSRQPLRDTSDLEVWSGAREHEGPLPPTVNAYLFSGFTSPGLVEIATVSRPTLVLGSSGLLLTAGLLSLYFPWLRRSAPLFVFGLAILAAAALNPDLALLAAQAAVVGAALVALAVVLERKLGRRRQVVLRGGSSSIVARSSTHTHPHIPGGSPASTQTAALALEMGAQAES